MSRAAPPTGVTPPRDRAETLSAVRKSVRGLLEDMPGYRQASPATRLRAARSLVAVCMAGADLVAEDMALTRAAAAVASTSGEAARAPAAPALAADTTPPLASLLASGQAIGDTGREGARVLQQTRDAIDFPTFVESLITGVFRAISNANVGQFERFASLLDSVAASTGEFSRTIPDGEAIRWVAQRFPALRVVGTGGRSELQVADDTDFEALRPRLREALEASSDELGRVTDDELSETLLPLVKRKLARDRQTMLATMINMGLQRVVVDEGRLHASMDLRVDTRAVQERLAEQSTEVSVQAGASGGFRGPGWGAQAYVDTSVAHVRADSEHSQEEINSQAGLRSSVDLAFRTEQVPLDRVANAQQRARIQAQAPTPVTVTPSQPAQSRLAQRQRPTVPRPTAGDRQHVQMRDVPQSRAEREQAAQGDDHTSGDTSGGDTSGGGTSGGDTPGDASGAQDTGTAPE